LYQGKLEIYGWIYHIETGELLAFDPQTHSYVPPQSQLSALELGTPYEKTSAPPVACNLPPKENGNSSRRTIERTPAASKPVRAEAPTEVVPWLTAEQAQRIYQGSRH
jgi:carbonic anhydrase